LDDCWSTTRRLHARFQHQINVTGEADEPLSRAPAKASESVFLHPVNPVYPVPILASLQINFGQNKQDLQDEYRTQNFAFRVDAKEAAKRLKCDPN